MAKHVRVKIYPRGKNPRKKPLATISFHGRSKKHAVARAKNFIRRRLKNIEMGFYDSRGVFHPIRASSDYSYGAAGEKRPRGGVGKARYRRAMRKTRKARKSAIS